MTFERDRVLMLRTTLAEEREFTDRLVRILDEISVLDVAEYDSAVGYQSAVRTLAHHALKAHRKKREGT